MTSRSRHRALRHLTSASPWLLLIALSPASASAEGMDGYANALGFFLFWGIFALLSLGKLGVSAPLIWSVKRRGARPPRKRLVACGVSALIDGVLALIWWVVVASAGMPERWDGSALLVPGVPVLVALASSVAAALAAWAIGGELKRIADELPD